MNIPTFIKKNRARKLTAIIFAWLVWYAVQLRLSDERDIYGVPIELSHPETMIVTQTLPKLDVTLSGAKKRLDQLNSDNIKVILTIHEKESTETLHTVKINKTDFDLPWGIQLIDFKPKRVVIQSDHLQQVEKPVHPRFAGELASGIDLQHDVTITPDTVTLTGPSKILSTINEIIAHPIELDSYIDNDFFEKLETALLIPSPHVIVTPNTVHITVRIKRQESQHTFKNLPVGLRIPKEYPLELVEFIDTDFPRVDVSIKGPKTAVSSLSSRTIRPFIDLTDIESSKPGIYRIHVRILIDKAGCILDTIEPKMFRVRIGNNREKIEALP